MAQSGRPDLRGGEAGVGALEGHPDREGEVGEVGVLRAPVLDREDICARVGGYVLGNLPSAAIPAPAWVPGPTGNMIAPLARGGAVWGAGGMDRL
jgi:hypothetical protein